MDTKNTEYFKLYPKANEIDNFVNEIYEIGKNAKVNITITDKSPYDMNVGSYHSHWENRFVEFKVEDENISDFCAIWQETKTGHDAPLLVNLPGYGMEACIYNEFTMEGFNVLTAMPMGYNTINGISKERMDPLGFADVLPLTLESNAQKGYKEFLIQGVIATFWALNQQGVISDRVSFFGNSQGGGTALLMGSIFSDRGTACVCADEPFLTNFPNSDFGNAFGYYSQSALEKISKEEAYKAAGYIDTISHAHRMTYPVLLTSGELDTSIPRESVKSLFDILDTNKCYMDIKNTAHRYTRQFIYLAKAYFRMYA